MKFLTFSPLSVQDTFQIENEDDAQMVLLVTRKLTDILMEYRLRSVSKVQVEVVPLKKNMDIHLQLLKKFIPSVFLAGFCPE